MKYDRTIIKTGAICGILGCLLFFGIVGLYEQLYWQAKFQTLVKTTGDFLSIMGSSPDRQMSMGTHLLVAFALLLFAVSFIGLNKALSYDKKRVLVTIGSVFGVLACAIMVEMAIVQGTTMTKMGKLFLESTPNQREIVLYLYRGLRYIDYGLDIAFDFFFFSAWILLGFAMLKHKYFGKIIGSVGIIIFIVTAILNLWAAPNPPSLELSPVCCLWILVVYIQALRSAKGISHENDPVMSCSENSLRDSL